VRTFTRSSERLAATIKPYSYDPNTRTATVVWSTGAKVRRETWDGPFDESLSLDPSHVRLEFLNSGKAPLLNAHRKGSATDQLGVIERAWIENGEGLAHVRFSEREDVAPIARDVEAGIINGVSVGYRIRKIKEMERQGGVPHLRAIDWEPKEISVVPLGADPDAGFRAEEDFHSCEVIRMDGEDQGQGTTTGKKPGGDTTGKETPPSSGSLPADRERMAEIVTLATRHGMGPEWAAEQIRNNATLDACRTAILGAM
jgi:hypothetical protein